MDEPESQSNAPIDGQVPLDPVADHEPFDMNKLLTRLFSGFVLLVCCGFIFWVVHPELVFTNTTPTGGDMGAHVWGPDYLRHVLLPQGRVTGWTNDWYAGFPAYTFYMVVPSLAIVALDVGFILPNSIVGVTLALVVLAAAGYAAWRISKLESRVQRALGWTACVLVPLLSIDLPYNIAFKLIAVSGVVLFPAGVWWLLRGLSLRRPGPELGAIASVAFLMDRWLFHIYGGNLASTLAGEFAFSISITLSLFALGCIAFGLRTGRYRVRAAVLTALAMLCHVIPGLFFLGLGALLMVVLRPRVSSLKWALPVGFSGGLMAMWWYVPFYGNSAFLNDMGWEKLGVQNAPNSWMQSQVFSALRGAGATTMFETSCSVVHKVMNWEEIRRNLLPLSSRMNGADPSDPLMWGGHFFFVLAVVGVALSFVMVVRSGIWLTLLTAIAAAAFVLMPQDRFWNARVLPFYYLGIYLLAAVGAALMLKAIVLVFRGRWTDPPLWVSATATGIALIVMWVGIGITLRILPGGVTLANSNAYHWLFWETSYRGPVRDWAKWNFEGLEQKPGASESVTTDDKTGAVLKREMVIDKKSSNEFFGMISMMKKVGRDNGCGRAYWEYGDNMLGKYGTPMAPMLLPYFTDHCIGSMEGLYFEASSTTPFHFLVQSELSAKYTVSGTGPSRPERFDCHLGFDDTPYRDFDLDLGIKHLQMLGVRYFLAFDDTTKLAADGDARLTLLGKSGPWNAYEVAEVGLVSPLENNPVVWDDVDDGIHSYARPAVDWFNDETKWDVLRATDGPSDWKRASKNSKVVVTPAKHPDAKITNVRTSSQSISFHVDKVGSPVLIRTSYFPNWDVSGASKVYRVTPNQMVVVPTSKDVRLTYGRSGIEWISALMSVAGFALLVRLLARPLAEYAVVKEYFGDRESRSKRDDDDDHDHDHDGDGDDLSPADTLVDDSWTDAALVNDNSADGTETPVIE